MSPCIHINFILSLKNKKNNRYKIDSNTHSLKNTNTITKQTHK